MSVELEEDLKTMTQVLYCDLGEERIQQIIETMKFCCVGKELKQIIKVIEKEKKIIDKRFKEYYDSYVNYKEIEEK